MLVLVSGATCDVAMAPPHIGVLLVPLAGNTVSGTIRGREWAIDNGAWSGFDADAFIRLLGEAQGQTGCRFVAAPDVVADAAKTVAMFRVWSQVIRALGFPVALVAQDGLTPRLTPWNDLDALFIGGSTDWKMSREVDQLLGLASALGKWRHVGRVNSRRRMRHFYGRTDSIDGSGFSQWPKRIRLANRWLQEFQRQPSLIGHV